MLLRLVATAHEYVHRDELARKSAKRRVADVTKRLGVLGARELRELALVPVNRQVLYMSCCSVVWNCILSQAGNTTKEETRDASKKTKTKKK